MRLELRVTIFWIFGWRNYRFPALRRQYRFV
jgi:hypothetical protein